MAKLVYPNGAATDLGAFIVAQVITDAGSPVPGNLLIDYRFERDPDNLATDWTVVSICYRDTESCVYAAGENGEILRITQTGQSIEYVMPGDDGPFTHGPLREIRLIGQDVYATGMGRQVYKRSRHAAWVRFDSGVLDETDTLASGFTSIAGDQRGDFLVAIGYEGEIWEYDEDWKKVDSPTDLLLNRVGAHSGKYYAAGLHGTIVCREREGWRIVADPDFDFDIWDLVTYRGSLLFGTTRGLFRLTDDETLERVDFGAGSRQVNCARLSAGRDRLWCFGSDAVSSSVDALTWREETLI